MYNCSPWDWTGDNGQWTAAPPRLVANDAVPILENNGLPGRDMRVVDSFSLSLSVPVPLLCHVGK